MQPPRPPVATPPSPQPCGLDCAYATPLRPGADDTGDWLWCTHPACPNRLVHVGRDCPRHQVPLHPDE